MEVLEADQGEGKADLWADQPGEGGGTRLANIGQIQTPVHSPGSLTQGPRICTSDFAGRDPSSPSEVAAT